jgi:hypothetical protein
MYLMKKKQIIQMMKQWIWEGMMRMQIWLHCYSLHNDQKMLNNFYNVIIPPANDENFDQAVFIGSTDVA